jgi:hypothetical protein
MLLTHAVLALVAMSPIAGATTWIVDVNNGPGTDFTQISTAIANVGAGDTLIVRPGPYASFVLDKQLSIVGLSDVSFPNATIQNLPAGTTTVLANLQQTVVAVNGFNISSNAGAVMVDQLTCAGGVQVTGSADVRFRRLDAQSGVGSSTSRVEIADSTVVGRVGGQCTCCSFPPGGFEGLAVHGGEVHVARSTVLGGNGGSIWCADPGVCAGGDGGAGIHLLSGARLVVAGSSQNFVQGGAAGVSSCGGPSGSPGPALWLDAGCEARVSGESLVGVVWNFGGALDMPTPDDPTLFALDAPLAGSLFTVRVHGPVGATADVILGRRPIIAGTPALDEEQLTPVNRVFHLGVIPANGTASLNFPVSPSWPQGFSVVFQGRLNVSGSTVYTNSVPAIVQ